MSHSYSYFLLLPSPADVARSEFYLSWCILVYLWPFPSHALFSPSILPMFPLYMSGPFVVWTNSVVFNQFWVSHFCRISAAGVMIIENVSDWILNPPTKRTFLRLELGSLTSLSYSRTIWNPWLVPIVRFPNPISQSKFSHSRRIADV